MKKTFSTLLVTVLMGVPIFSATATWEVSTGALQNPTKFDTFSQLAAQVTKTAVEILLPFVVLAFIWSGFLFVRAQGNQKELEDAKTAIKWSIIGAFILMGAWGFATIISDTLTTLTS